MAHLEEDYEYNCPYCMELISIRIDNTGGRQQTLVTDCEVCCQPIQVEIEMDEDGVANFIAKREGEG